MALGPLIPVTPPARTITGHGGIGLDANVFGTHSLRRTKATLIYRRTVPMK